MPLNVQIELYSSASNTGLESHIFAFIFLPQGKIWVRNKESKNELQVTNLNHKYFRQHLEDALSLGRPLLIEDITEELDPALDNILEKNFIKVGESMVDLREFTICPIRVFKRKFGSWIRPWETLLGEKAFSFFFSSTNINPSARENGKFYRYLHLPKPTVHFNFQLLIPSLNLLKSKIPYVSGG